MATRKAEVAITCNIRQPKQAQKILISALESLRKEYDRLVAAGKQNEAETQKMKKDMDALSSAVDTNKQSMNRIKSVMDNLSGSTLKQLNAALREVKRQMSGKSSNSADLAKMQSQYNAITEQIKKLKGETLDITKGMRTLSSQTDAWLTKAIAKQKELMAQTRRNTQEYQAQKSVLKHLMAEQGRRSGLAVQTRGNAAMALARNPAKASMAELRDARQSLVAYRDNIGKSGINFGSTKANADQIKYVNDLLKAIDKQMDSINGKEQKVTLTTQQLVQSVKQIDFDKASPKQLKAKLDEVNNALANMAKNDPMRSQLLQSARQLQSALDGLEGKVVNVKGVLANLDKASPQKLQAALDQVNNKLNHLGQNDSRRKALLQDAEKLRAALKRVNGATVDVKKVLDNLKSAPLQDLKRAAAQLEREMAELNRVSDHKLIAQKKEQIRKLNQEIQRVNKSVAQQESGWKKTLSAITAYMGVTMLIGRIQQMLTSVLRLNLEFSDQLANIRKVSGLAMKDINALSDNLAKIDTRTSIQELSQIAYAGAKLGIGQYGIEGLEGFTRAANRVNVALKEDLGEDALTALSKITEVMGLIPKMGVEQSMLATGSAMFKLSATSTATAGNIVEFSKRLTGLAKVTGITTDQLLGLASASDSMYLMPEVSATAFNKLFSSLQTKHNLIEKELSIAPGTISNLYSAGRAMDAIILIFEKMKQKGNMNALQGVFKDLGSDGARLVNVMVTMSQNVDMLKDHLDVAEESFREATAVTDEYNIQQETAQALMERAGNIWQKSFVNSEGVDVVKSFSQAWYNVSKWLNESSLAMGLMKGSLGALLFVVQALVYALPVLLLFFTFKGVATAVMGVVAAVRALEAGTVSATIAQYRYNAACQRNFWVALATVIVSVVVAIRDLSKATEKAVDTQRSLNQAVASAESEYFKAAEQLKSYRAALESANTSAEQRERILRRINKEFSPYLKHLGIEINSVQDLRDNYAKLNDELRKNAYYKMRTQVTDDLLYTDGPDGSPSLSRQRSGALMDYATFIKSSPYFAAYDTKWLEEMLDRGMSSQDIAMNMVHGAFDYISGNGAGGVQTAHVRGYGIPDYGSMSPDQALKLFREKNRNEINDEFLSAPSASGRSYFKLPEDNGMVTVNLNSLVKVIDDVKRPHDEMRSTEKLIRDTFDPALGDYSLDYDDSPLGSLDNVAPDKDALKTAKEEERRLKRQYRAEIKELQGEVTGIIDNLKNFFTRQANAVTGFANEAGWDPALLDNTLDVIEADRESALAEARKAIVGIPNRWSEVVAGLEAYLVELDSVIGIDENGTQYAFNASRDLIDKLRNADPDAIRSRLGFLDRELGATDGTSLAEVWNKASENEQRRDTAEQRRQREYQQYLLEHNYQDKVDSDHTAALTRLGYFDINFEQEATLLKGSRAGAFPEEKEAAERVLKDRMDAIKGVLESAVRNYVDILAVGEVSSDEGRNRFLSLIFGEDYDESAVVLRGIVESDAQEMELFYHQIIKYVDDYTEAAKKAADRTRKLYDFQWNASPEKASLDARERASELYRKGLVRSDDPALDFGVYGNSAFMSDFGVDPEIEAYRLKIEAARAYYDFIEAHGATEAQLAEQRKNILAAQDAYVQQLASRIKKQMDEVLGLHKPIEDFGTKAGEAFALMSQDAQAGHVALKKAVTDMIGDFMKQTVEMTKEYLKRRIMQKVHDRLMSVEASAHEAELTEIQSSGDNLRFQLHQVAEEGISTIDSQSAAERVVTHQSEVVEEVGTEAKGTQAKIGLGIAGGAAETIGSLGWWGIPLVAVISMLLNGLLSFAMSKVSSLFGGKSASDSGAQTKLVSGMLTYDSGNVQAFRGVEDGRTYPVVGSDGRVYAAKDGGELSTGLVEDPITTLVNGQPALVAERGPEMVIGRETTAAMMMARPDILAEIVRFDRQRSGRTYRAYDSGNIDSLQLSVPNGSNAEDMAQLRETINTLALVLSALQRDGIPAHINNLGRGGVTDAATAGQQFMRRYSSSPIYRRP